MQYAAVARMRLQMMGHSTRTGRGQFDILSEFASWAVYLLLGVIFAISFGAGAYYILHDRHTAYFGLLMWGVLAMWQLTPIMAISFREEYDLSGLARYPLGFGAYYLLFLFYGFFDYSTVFGLASILGISVGVALARPSLLPITLIALFFFAIFNILLNRALFAWLSRWLAQRRTREMLGVLFFVFVITAELLNPALHQFHEKIPTQLLLALKALEPLSAVFPPGLVGGSLHAAATAQALLTLALLAGAAAWIAVPAGFLGFRLHAQYRGENLSEAPVRTAGKARTSAKSQKSRFNVSGPIAAILVKEARYLMRSYQLLYGLVAPLILMLVFTGSPTHHAKGVIVAPERLLFPLAVFYAFLGLTRLIFNSLGAEGSGLQFYFVAPAPLWKVMFGKNLFHGILLAVELAVLWTIAVLRAGPPSASELVLTLCAITFIVPANFTAANLVALYMPYRMNFARLGRPQGASASNLVSLLSQLALFGFCAAVDYAASALGGPWVASGIFLILGVIACAAYWVILRGFGTRAQKRIDVLLNDLARPAS
jgi:ABC-2 type transport system permease protein